jgi:hypothetical protein
MKVHRSSCKVPITFVRLKPTWIFLKNLQKILKYQISWKSVQSEQSFPCRQTDTTKLTFASEILDVPKNMKQIWFMIFLSTPFYNSSWGIQTRLWDELHRNGRSVSAKSKRLFFSPKHPDRLWSPPSLLFNGWECFLWVLKQLWSKPDHSPACSEQIMKIWWNKFYLRLSTIMYIHY